VLLPGESITVTVAVADNGRLQVPLPLVRFKVVSEVTAVTVTFSVPPPIAVPDACIIYSYFPVYSKGISTRTNRTMGYDEHLNNLRGREQSTVPLVKI
jgi:hypothetical protein